MLHVSAFTKTIRERLVWTRMGVEVTSVLSFEKVNSSAGVKKKGIEVEINLTSDAATLLKSLMKH